MLGNARCLTLGQAADSGRIERNHMKSRTGAMTAVGALMLLNGLAIGAPWIISEWTSATEVTFLDSVGDWRYAAFNSLYLVAVIAFVAAAPTLTSWVGRGGRRLPGWLVPVIAAAAALQACTLFSQAVVSPFLLEVAPVALTTEDGGAFAIIMVGDLDRLDHRPLPARGRRLAPARSCRPPLHRHDPRSARHPDLRSDRQHPGRWCAGLDRMVPSRECPQQPVGAVA